MGFEEKEVGTGSNQKQDVLLNIEEETSESEETQNPEQSPLQKEQELIKPLFDKIKNKFPLFDSKYFLEKGKKDIFLIGVFLTDFLRNNAENGERSNKTIFPYAENGEKGPLGQEERYGDWKSFILGMQDLTSIDDPKYFQQAFARCFDLWKPAFLEHTRGFQNDRRVKGKSEKFMEIFIRKFPNQDLKQLEEICKEKRKKEGTLTFEVFLDEVIKEPELFKGENLTFTDLYRQREQRKIEQLGKVNMDINTFEKVIQLSGTNNESLKKNAENEIKKLRNTSLTKEQIANKVEYIYNKNLEPAVKGYGMLNREEVIKTAFVGLTEKDYREGGLFLKKIQVIGKYYYDFHNILIDGIWGPQTESVLLSLKKNEIFHEYWETIDDILKNNKSYGEKAKKLSQQLIDNQEKTKIKETVITSIPSQKSESSSQKSESPSVEPRSNSLNKIMENLSGEKIKNAIPRELYLDAIRTFIHGQKDIPEELKADIHLAEKILDGTGTGDMYEEIQQLWEKSESHKNFLEAQTTSIRNQVDTTINDNIRTSRDNFFNEMGLPLQLDTQLSDAYAERYGKEKGTYSVFTDPHNPLNHYIYNHKSGYLSAKKDTHFNQQNKSVSLNATAEEYKIIMKFPTAEELSKKILDNGSYIPHSRVDTLESFQSSLLSTLKEATSHSAGTVESAMIKDNIEENRLETSIITTTKKLLHLTNESSLSPDTQRAKYEIFVPILNTVSSCTPSELKELDLFLKTLDEHTNHDGLVNKEGDSYEDPIFKSLSQADNKKYFQEESKQKPKSEFGLGILFQGLEKTPEGQINAIENNVINIDKIKFLNHIKDRTAREQDQQLGKWYTNLVQSIRSSTLKICEQQDQLLCRTECSKIEHKLNTIYTEEQAFS